MTEGQLEKELEEAVERNIKSAPMPRPTALDRPPYLTASSGSVEAKLQAIEKLVAEIRVVSSQIKSQLG